MFNEKILITGGAGYVGSMLATKLIEKGYKVTVIDNLRFSKNSLDHLFIYRNFKFIYGDVRNKNLIKKNIKKHNIIIPLAALVGAPLCEKYKKEAKEINFESIKYMLKIINKKQKIIFPTTNSGYGIGQKEKYCDENSPLNPISFYGKTKAEAEKIVLEFENSICFRLATIFGYSYRMRTDLLVNNFVYKALKFKKLKLYEPHFRRNYIHIIDVVRAFIFAIKNFNKLKSNTYNLGLSSANLTKLMLAKKIKKQFKEVKISIIRNRKDPDQRDYFVSNKKIEKKGFKPIISLEEGIAELLNVLRFEKKIINNC
jgi:nucleoside-diphosphate-sugar epimerase